MYYPFKRQIELIQGLLFQEQFTNSATNSATE